MSIDRFMRLLGSWWLTALLLLLTAAAYLALSVGRNPYPAWVQMLFHSPGGIALLVGFIVNLSAASVRTALARLRPQPVTPAYIRSLDVFVELPQGDAEAVRRAAEVFRLPAAAPPLPETAIRQVTGRWSFLPGTVFRAGLVLTLIGLLLSAHTRRSSDFLLRDGESRRVDGAAVTLASIRADLPADHLQVGEDGTFLLGGVSAQLAVDGSTAAITPGFPARINGTWYRIRHLGYSQEMTVVLRSRQHRIEADLDLLPPGRSSSVPLPPGEGSLSFTLDPDRTIEKGLLKGRQYNLAKPAYRVGFREGRQQEEGRSASMRPGERGTVGPATVVLGRQGLAVRVQTVSDPGLPLLYAGAVIVLTGLCALLSRFFWYEREVALLATGGVLLTGSRDEFFRKWGVHRFLALTEKLRQ